MPEGKLDFVCSHCGKKVYFNDLLGNHQRNHCPYCLWSKHEDLNKSGDRLSDCHGLMEPIGLTVKKEKLNKYGLNELGEILLVHHCLNCGKINLNHLAADDSEEEVLKVFEKSLTLDPLLKAQLEQAHILLLTLDQLPEIKKQLYGK